MKLRIQPWFTDACTIFLNNLFKWYPQATKDEMHVLEWGGGNSTIYFLQNKCKLLTIESNQEYVDDLMISVRQLGFNVIISKSIDDAIRQFDEHDLTILQVKTFEDVSATVFEAKKWTFILNDGISRCQVNEAIDRSCRDSIIIIDNVEYAANWGKLERCSAHPDRVKSYRRVLRDPAWAHFIFEQPEGRGGNSSPDFSGWVAPHRWISAVLWRQDHLLAELMISNIGLPLVTPEGIDDEDVRTLPMRCPFDWQEMKWLVDEYRDVFKLKNY